MNSLVSSNFFVFKENFSIQFFLNLFWRQIIEDLGIFVDVVLLLPIQILNKKFHFGLDFKFSINVQLKRRSIFIHSEIFDSFFYNFFLFHFFLLFDVFEFFDSWNFFSELVPPCALDYSFREGFELIHYLKILF